MWDLVPWPGVEPGPPVLGPSLSHWTTREVPIVWVLPPCSELEGHRPQLFLCPLSQRWQPCAACFPMSEKHFHVLSTFLVVYGRKLSPVLVILEWLEVSEDGNLKKKKLRLKLTYNISFRCTKWWFYIRVYCKMITIMLISITIQLEIFFLMMRTFKIYSQQLLNIHSWPLNNEGVRVADPLQSKIHI